MAQAPEKYRVHEIDLLRFSAALAVVLFHYTYRGAAADGYSHFSLSTLAPVTKYGFMGVNLFFIISGFVILLTAQHGSMRKFLISRVTRLYPAFWVSCTLTALTIWLAGDPKFTVEISQWLVNMTMMNGFLGVPSVDGVYWSLFVELKFYLLVLVLIYFGRMQEIEKYLWIWLVAALILWAHPLPIVYALFIPQYAPYFVAGAAFYLVFRDGWSLRNLILLLTSFAMSMIMLHDEWLQLLDYYKGSDFEFLTMAGILSGFFMAFLLITLGMTRRFSYPMFVYLGALTYPLYLIHQYAGYILFNKLGTEQPPALLLIEVITLMLVVAYLVHVLVERRYAKPLGILVDGLLTRIAARQGIREV